eukprot:gene2861-3307_t
MATSGETVQPETEEEMEKQIEVEIKKLTYYSEQAEEVIDNEDYEEIKMIAERAEAIQGKLGRLIMKMEELKIENGRSAREVRQWKKETKDRFKQEVEDKERLWTTLKEYESNKEESRTERRQTEQERLFREQQIMQFEFEKRLREERYQQEKSMWEERIEAEMKLTEKRLEMESGARSNYSKLPELRVTQFKGTTADWVRFENMFKSQVLNKSFSDEIKFGYLLEMVNNKVREKIGNLKPGKAGLEIAWDRLQKEYGQTQTVINTHIEEIVNLPAIRGSNFTKIQEFYESLTKNNDALLTLGEEEMLRGFVMTTLNKLQGIKSDLVRIDENWETWDMHDLIENVQKWLKRNRSAEETGKPIEKREKHWYSGESHKERQKKCIFCHEDHWSDTCKQYDTIEKRREHFKENKLCFNCGKGGHRGSACYSKGCYFCKSKHHTSLCNREKGKNAKDSTMTGYAPAAEETLPPIIPCKINDETIWAFLDTGSGRNFISKEAIKMLNLKPERFETKTIMTVNGTKKQSMPIYKMQIKSVDDKAREEIEVTGADLRDFSTITRPDLRRLKTNYNHTKDKSYYMTPSGKHTIHLILGDRTYSKIKTEEIFKGMADEPIVEGTTFGWIIHGGDFPTNECYYARDTSDYEKLYTLDILGVEDRGENDELDVMKEFKENIPRDEEGRYQGPQLQPHLWDIMIRARMTPNLLLGDIQKAFLQIGVKEEDRDAFRFLFTLKGKQEHLRQMRVPFGAEASPFMLGATLNHHYDQYRELSEYTETVKMLRENTYVDNLMCTGWELDKLEKFKRDSTAILHDAKFPVHKWESNHEQLEDENMKNPTKILGHTWDKREDTLEIVIDEIDTSSPVTKASILSQLGKIYDPLGIISPTLVEGKRIYRDACDENKNWNTEISKPLAKDYLSWIRQLRNVKIPRSLIKENRKVKSVSLHLFADASEMACSAVTVAVIEQSTGIIKGLLTSKSRISKRNTSIARLELVGGQMAANMAKNIYKALESWPITSVNVWMDSMVALFWISNPGKSWKVFVANRVRKISEITEKLGVKWRYCPSNLNIADLGSRGANINKLCKGEWFDGPSWILAESEWPCQPEFRRNSVVNTESKPIKEIMLHVTETEKSEWDLLLERKSYWTTIRTTAWVLRFTGNCVAKKEGKPVKKGPLTTEEIIRARDSWIRKLQSEITEIKQTPVGKSLLTFEQLETVVMDIERNMNNRPLTYTESDTGEESVLTPSIIMWGRNCQILDDVEIEEETITKMQRRLKNAREHAWQRWRKEYLHSLMEVHRMNSNESIEPRIGEIVLVIGEGKNRGKWKKGKVVELIRGKDGVTRGVAMLHKGHILERPLQAVCPLEIRSSVIAEAEDGVEDRDAPTDDGGEDRVSISNGGGKDRVATADGNGGDSSVSGGRTKRQAALNSTMKTKVILKDNEED